MNCLKGVLKKTSASEEARHRIEKCDSGGSRAAADQRKASVRQQGEAKLLAVDVQHQGRRRSRGHLGAVSEAGAQFGETACDRNQ